MPRSLFLELIMILYDTAHDAEEVLETFRRTIPLKTSAIHAHFFGYTRASVNSLAVGII